MYCVAAQRLVGYAKTLTHPTFRLDFVGWASPTSVRRPQPRVVGNAHPTATYWLRSVSTQRGAKVLFESRVEGGAFEGVILGAVVFDFNGAHEGGHAAGDFPVHAVLDTI